MSCSTAAACSGGNASSSRNDVTSCAQTKNGSRIIVSPGARSCRIVTMMLIEPTSDDDDRAANMPKSHAVWPAVAMIGERRIRRPSGVGGAARQEEARDHDEPAREVQPVAQHVQARKRHVRRADHQRDEVVAERADGERHDGEKHHDRAVHRAELRVELGQHACRPARSAVAEQAADERHGVRRPRELPADRAG